MEKIFARCIKCGEIIVRYPGKQHGDGQIDSDASPVWLLADVQMVRDAGINPDDLQTVHCGC